MKLNIKKPKSTLEHYSEIISSPNKLNNKSKQSKNNEKIIQNNSLVNQDVAHVSNKIKNKEYEKKILKQILSS
jgi:hypothetical protein